MDGQRVVHLLLSRFIIVVCFTFTAAHNGTGMRHYVVHYRGRDTRLTCEGEGDNMVHVIDVALGPYNDHGSNIESTTDPLPELVPRNGYCHNGFRGRFSFECEQKKWCMLNDKYICKRQRFFVKMTYSCEVIVAVTGSTSKLHTLTPSLNGNEGQNRTSYSKNQKRRIYNYLGFRVGLPIAALLLTAAGIVIVLILIRCRKKHRRKTTSDNSTSHKLGSRSVTISEPIPIDDKDPNEPTSGPNNPDISASPEEYTYVGAVQAKHAVKCTAGVNVNDKEEGDHSSFNLYETTLMDNQLYRFKGDPVGGGGTEGTTAKTEGTPTTNAVPASKSSDVHSSQLSQAPSSQEQHARDVPSSLTKRGPITGEIYSVAEKTKTKNQKPTKPKPKPPPRTKNLTDIVARNTANDDVVIIENDMYCAT